MPDDMRRFYLRTNGTDDITALEHGAVRFWAVHEWRTVRDVFGEGAHPTLAKAVVFADYLYSSWAFAADFGEPSEVVAISIVGGAGTGDPIAGSFGEFVELVLADDESIYPADSTSAKT